MDRLTERGITYNFSKLDVSEIRWLERVQKRLAAYEDTGLTPEEIRKTQEALKPIEFSRFREILEAEREGRLEILPCKVGDVVWLIDYRFTRREKGRSPVVKCRVNEFSNDGRSTFAVLDGAERWYRVRRFTAVDVNDFGKTVFLSREDAEKAMEKAK